MSQVSQRVSQREPESESERAREWASEPEWVRERQRVSQREPESEIEGLEVNLRVTLGPKLGCQRQQRQ